MKQLRLISGFLILAMALAAIACSNPAASPAALATYSVTYDANGATGGSAPDAQTKIQGTDLALATNSGTLVRTGDTFAGWNTMADGSGTTHAMGATYSANANLALFAKWTVEMASIPAGSFDNGTSIVTLSAFRMAKYDIT